MQIKAAKSWWLKATAGVKLGIKEATEVRIELMAAASEVKGEEVETFGGLKANGWGNRLADAASG